MSRQLVHSDIPTCIHGKPALVRGCASSRLRLLMMALFLASETRGLSSMTKVLINTYPPVQYVSNTASSTALTHSSVCFTISFPQNRSTVQSCHLSDFCSLHRAPCSGISSLSSMYCYSPSPAGVSASPSLCFHLLCRIELKTPLTSLFAAFIIALLVSEAALYVIVTCDAGLSNVIPPTDTSSDCHLERSV